MSETRRYQVFLSSTFADLMDERQKVMQALLEMDCIPSGMEIFPASNDEQFAFIKKVIDTSDYYILIIGGRYGSLTKEGISYTEKEYDYANEKSIPICAFVHADPGSIVASKTEQTPILARRLEKFREKVCSGRMVKMWSEPKELPGQVAISLNQTIRSCPSPGWIRGDQAATVELYQELERLRRENLELRTTRLSKKKNMKIDDQEVGISFRDSSNEIHEKSIEIRDLIKSVPTSVLGDNVNHTNMKNYITECVFGFEDSMDYHITDRSYNDLVFVLDQLGLLVSYSGYVGFTTKFKRSKLGISFGIFDY